MTLSVRVRASLIAAIVSSAAIASMFAAGAPASMRAAKKPFAGQTLVVVNWKGYGSDLPWAVHNFEQMTGAKVVHEYKTSDPAEITLLQNGGVGKVDVAIVNHAYMQPLIQAGLLQPLDTAKLSSYGSIYPQLKNLASLHSAGKTYGIPWEWGLTSLAYNAKDTGGPITSWSALWGKQYAGKIAFFDDPQTAVETAAFYLHENPAHPDLAKVHTALSELLHNVKTFWGSTNDWTRAFSTGQAVIGNAWSSLPAELNQPHITLALPKEGSVGWVDSWTMVKNAPHPALAYAWINYMTGVQFLTSFAKDPTHSSPAPANMAAVKQLSTSLLTRLGAKPAWLSRLAFVQVTPTDLKSWTQLWETVKAGG